MIALIERFKNIKREDVTTRRIFNAILRRFAYIPHYLAWKIPWGFAKANRERLLQYKNIHKGKRCFIVANGPSLKNIDFSLLKDEYTIGMNRIYLMKDVNGFSPTYLAVADIPIQLSQFTEEYNNLPMPCFYSWLTRRLFIKKEKLMFFIEGFNMKFQPDVLKPVGSGKSVTYFCIQLAFYMGFSEVIIIGKDHSYNIEGKPGEVVNSDGKEENHFIKGYYKTNQIWKIPNFSEEEFTYKISRIAFENDGRKIVDATVNGKLNVFEKVDYRSLFIKEKVVE